MLQAGRSPVRFSIRSLDFSIDLIQPHYGSGVDSTLNRNEYQDLPWGKERPASKADDRTAICEPIL
jgi:hypothetical protein